MTTEAKGVDETSIYPTCDRCGAPTERSMLATVGFTRRHVNPGYCAEHLRYRINEAERDRDAARAEVERLRELVARLDSEREHYKALALGGCETKGGEGV